MEEYIVWAFAAVGGFSMLRFSWRRVITRFQQRASKRPHAPPYDEAIDELSESALERYREHKRRNAL